MGPPERGTHVPDFCCGGKIQGYHRSIPPLGLTVELLAIDRSLERATTLTRLVGIRTQNLIMRS
jgi:hypothetical protein